MQIFIESTLLCSGDLATGRIGPIGLALNGRHLFDEVDYFHGAEPVYESRNGLGTTLTFTVRHLFDTVEDASAFYLSHWAGVPKSGDVQCVVGSGVSARVLVLAGAVLELSQPELRGTNVLLQYTIRGGLFTVEDIALPEEGDVDLSKRGNVALSAGDSSKVITFAAPFATAPTDVRAKILPTSGVTGYARFIECTVLYDTISTTGFTVAFAADIPTSSTHKLYWSATL